MDSEQKYYAIREVAAMTNVKPVTLRAWQRRYHLLHPRRTEKGHRLYSEQDIQLIRRVQSWLAKGVSIGHVTRLMQADDPSAVSVQPMPMLAEVDKFLSALAGLNRGKAEIVVTAVMKNYPLDIAKAQFIVPVDEALNQVQGPQRSLQRGLFRSIMVTQLSWMITSANRASHLGKCLCVSLDTTGSLWAWFRALQMAEQGYFTVLLDGIEELSGLAEHDALVQFQRVDLFANQVLTKKQQDGMTRLLMLKSPQVSCAGTLLQLHREMVCP